MNNTLLSYPQRVYNVLKLCEEQRREDIISWVNDGTAFKVNNVQEFERDLLPWYFNTNKYYTFTRALYAHRFTCVRRGRQTGIYSHPNFNRNDPLSISLIKRVTKKERRKEAAPPKQHAVSDFPLVEQAANNRSTSSRMPAAISNDHQICQFPRSSLLFNETTNSEDDGGAGESVFGRKYHMIESQVFDLVTSLPDMVAQRFDSKGDTNSVVMRSSYPNPTPLTSTITNPASFRAAVAASSSNGTPTDEGQNERKPISPNGQGNLFILGSDHMAPAVVSPLRKVVVNDGTGQEENLYHFPDGHSRYQEQGVFEPIPLLLPPTTLPFKHCTATNSGGVITTREANWAA